MILDEVSTEGNYNPKGALRGDF